MNEMPTPTRPFHIDTVKLLPLTLITVLLALLGISHRAQAQGITHTFAAIQSAAASADYSQTASRNGYVILQAWETRRMHELKSQNPSLKVLVYKNLAYSAAKPSATAPASTGVSTNEAPSSWYLLNTSGQRVLPNGFTWMSAMDVGNREYQERWASNVVAELESQGWDGVFMDDVNPTIKYAYTPSSVAKYPSDATYSAAMQSAIAYIGPQIQAHGKLAVANFSCWAEYHNQLNGWLDYLSGALDEMFVKWGSKSGEGFRPEAQWKEQIEEAAYAAAHGKIFLGFTQGAEGETQAARYGYASLLLTGDGASSYSFIPNYSAEAWMPEYEYAIGDPTGTYRKDTSGAYVREFSNGLVVVNPGTSSRTVKFGGTYSGSGLTNATEATLPAYSALVLTLTSKAPPVPTPPVTTPVSTTPVTTPPVTTTPVTTPPVKTSPTPTSTSTEVSGPIAVTVTAGPEKTEIAWKPAESVAGQVVSYEVQRDDKPVAKTKKRHRVERHRKRGARYRIVALGKNGKVVARSRIVKAASGSGLQPVAPSAA